MVVCWGAVLQSSYVWVPQDLIGIAIIVSALRTVRIDSMKVDII